MQIAAGEGGLSGRKAQCDLEKQVPTFRVALGKWQKLHINVVSSVCENDGLASVHGNLNNSTPLMHTGDHLPC